MLQGANGSDRLIGGVGADVMHVGVRNGQIDVLVFESFADSRGGSSDRIHDFERGIDKIDLSRMDGGIHQEGDPQLTRGGSSLTANGAWVARSLFEGATIRAVGDSDGDSDSRADVEARRGEAERNPIDPAGKRLLPAEPSPSAPQGMASA